MLRFSYSTLRSVHGTLVKVNGCFGLRCFSAGEQWKEIPGFPNYHVSNFGRVKKIKRNSCLHIITEKCEQEYVCVAMEKREIFLSIDWF